MIFLYDSADRRVCCLPTARIIPQPPFAWQGGFRRQRQPSASAKDRAAAAVENGAVGPVEYLVAYPELRRIVFRLGTGTEVESHGRLGPYGLHGIAMHPLLEHVSGIGRRCEGECRR